jgi:hypothetical protein
MAQSHGDPARPRSRSMWRDNGLSIVLMAIFALTLAGQALAGWSAEIEELARHGRPPPTLVAYLASGDFLSTVFENWESEFLQMAAYVVMTGILFQRGSAESRDPDETPEDRTRRDAVRSDSPWPARAGPTVRWLYGHSLGIALLLLFAASFVLHWWNSWRASTEAALRHGSPAHALLAHLADAEFWFESFQNWQSEFLSTAALVLLTIVLRQKGSPTSKPLGAPNEQTGD